MNLSARTLVLQVLATGSWSASDVADLVRERMAGTMLISAGQAWKALRMLEEEGLVVGATPSEDKDHSRTRTWFKLTEEGLEEVRKERAIAARLFGFEEPE